MVLQATLVGLLQVVYRRKWTIVLVAGVIVALGAVYLINAVPLYRSDAALVVRFGRSAVPVTNLARDSTPYVVDQNERREMIQAHADILTSPDVAAAAIEKFGLRRLYPNLTDQPPEVGTAMDSATKRFGASLGISTEFGGDGIRVAFMHPDPVVAKDMLDTLIDVYMQRESQIFSGSSVAFQTSQVDQALARVSAAQKDLTAFKAQTGLADFDTQMNSLIKQKSDLDSRFQAAEVALAESVQKREALTKLIATVPATVSSSSGDKYRQIDDSQSRVNALRAQEREMIATHGADWPALRALRASIAEASASTATATATAGDRRNSGISEVHQSIQLDLLRATASSQANQQAVDLITQQQAKLQADIAALEATHAGLLERQRELDLADTAYRTLSLHLADSRIGADRLRDGISRVAIITQPNLPYSIAKPRYKFTGAIIVLVAFMAGLFVAFARELFDDRLITAEQVTSRLNVPVLATFDKT